MEFYSREEIAEQKKMRGGFRLAAFIVSGLALAAVVAMFFMEKPDTQTRYTIAAAAVAGLAGSFDIYVASFIMPYMRPKPKKRDAVHSVLHVLGNMLRQLHMYLIWIILSAIIISFAFNQKFETVPAKEIVIYADVASLDQPALETLLDEELPEGIEVVKVRQTGYDLFGMPDPAGIDIYLLPASEIEGHLEFLAPLSELYASDNTSPDSVWSKDGAAYGLLLFAAGGQDALPGSDLIEFKPGEDYYFCFGANGLHRGAGGQAAQTADRLRQILADRH